MNVPLAVCGYTERVPEQLPKLRMQKDLKGGYGTEKIERDNERVS